MVKRLYIDGCSLTYGQGLPRAQSLGALLRDQGGYVVTDNSRPGKSNMAIAVDTYNNWQNHDVFVLGFTFSNRFGIRYQGHDLDFYPGFQGQDLNLADDINGQELSDAFKKNYRYFYTVFGYPYCDELSDMLIDGVAAFLTQQQRRLVAYTWEPRQTQHQLLNPFIGPDHRLPDLHLNRQGMQYLYDLIQNQLNE